jgi:hypothetical protein
VTASGHLCGDDVTASGPARAQGRDYLTVSVPFMPAASWPSTEQKNV